MHALQLRNTGFILGLVVVSLAAAACGDDSTKSNGPKADAGSDAALGDAGSDAAVVDTRGPEKIAVVAYNVALAPLVLAAQERVAPLGEAVSAIDADVVCLQEVFRNVTTPEDFVKLVAAKFPHAHHTDAQSTTDLGNGLVLLSKWPFETTHSLAYENVDDTVDRAALAVDITVEERRFRVACTHLTAGLSKAGKSVRADQIDQLVTWLDGLPKLHGPEFLLGDFNAGPDPVMQCTATTDPACDAPDLSSYNRVLEHFDDPNADLDACTQCREIFNPMQTLGIFEKEPDQRIDHCFVRDLAPYEHEESGVVFDEKVAIMVGDKTAETLSDHLGVRCAFAR